MEDEVDECIRKKIPWSQLPASVKRLLDDSQREYEKYVYVFSIRNQLRYRGNLVRRIKKDERKYYEALIQNSIERLMLFPYHLADMIVKGLRITPFIYYTEVVGMLIEMEKSYDTLPNFTAADCLRLLGIGRNEYLDLVAKARTLSRRGKGKAIRALLPHVPQDIPMQPWWRVELGYVLEEDVKPLSTEERNLIDLLIDRGSQTAGTLDHNVVRSLYRRGLIYLDVPITAEDRVSVPPLKGFVMNRIAGDYFETLLYKVFVTIDEHTTVAELASVLQVECESVKQAVSLYCRVGFARLLQPPPSPAPHALHPSWAGALTEHRHPPYRQIAPLTFNGSVDDDTIQMEPVLIKDDVTNDQVDSCDNSGLRVAILFDSTLAAYLMMGNLSPDLKSHAVTLFEVGKLCDESLDSLLQELDKVDGGCGGCGGEIEGEARRYLAAARCLRLALRRLRHALRPLDLLRCEALHALGAATRARLLRHKYRVCVSTAPLCREARAGAAAGALPHVGPAPPEAASPWMRLYLYHVAGYGPPSLLLTKGTQLRAVPRALLGFSRLLVVWWGMEAEGSEGGALPAAAALAAANSALRRQPVLLQAVGVRRPPRVKHVVFPPDRSDAEECALWAGHAGLRRLAARLRLARTAGYVTLADIGLPDYGTAHPPDDVILEPPKKRRPTFGVAKPISELSLSSTETEVKQDDLSKCIDHRLQSPIESHFAVTPTIDSKSSSPANGITNPECSELLCEELDNLDVTLTPDLVLKHSQLESDFADNYSSSVDEKVADSSGNKKESDFVDKYSSSVDCNDKQSGESEAADSGRKLGNSVDCKVNACEEGTARVIELGVKRDPSVDQLADLLSPSEESISMFAQLSDKLAEVTTEGDSGVDVAHNTSDDETSRAEKWTILDLQFGIPLFDEDLCGKICQSIVDRLTKPENLEKLKEDNDFIRADLLKFVSQCQYYPGEDMGIVKRGSLVPLPRKCLVFENGKISEWNGK